jgi:hypothetical protein
MLDQPLRPAPASLLNGRRHRQLSVQSSREHNDLGLSSPRTLDRRVRYSGHEMIDRQKACLSVLYSYSPIFPASKTTDERAAAACFSLV